MNFHSQQFCFHSKQLLYPSFLFQWKYFLLFFGRVFLFKDLIITCLEMMAFQKHLSQQFSTGDVDKNISFFFFFFKIRNVFSNVQLWALPSFNSSWKNLLHREIRFLAAVDANIVGSCRFLWGGGEKKAQKLLGSKLVPTPGNHKRMGNMCVYI